MIFVTVGTQLKFDRLIEWVELCLNSSNHEIVAQIGNGKKPATHIKYFDYCDANIISQYINDAEIIISHAGMGTVLNAIKYNKKLIIVPRQYSLGEHRNDHQMATAKWIESKKICSVAYSCSDLYNFLQKKSKIIHCKQSDLMRNEQILLKSTLNNFISKK